MMRSKRNLIAMTAAIGLILPLGNIKCVPAFAQSAYDAQFLDYPT